MKINRLIIWLFVFFLSFSSCKSSHRNELNMLTVKDTQINEAIKELLIEESDYGNLEKSVILIKMEKLEIGYEIRMGALYKENISSYLSGKKDKPLGLFEFEGITVAVFGEEESLLFEKTSNTQSFPFLKAKSELKVKEGEIPPPPVIYEPIVWVYAYENGKLKLTDKGRFTLLI
jgi:hypothetical protein